MTPVEKAADAAMIWIRDEPELDFDRQYRPPVFYNRMWYYLPPAILRFNRPPEIQGVLAELTPPRFADGLYICPAASAGPTVIPSGEKGYTLVSAGQVDYDDMGDKVYTPLTVTAYNAQTGDVTIAEAVEEDERIELDFYASGHFAADLDSTQLQLLGCCIYNVWEHRFSNRIPERTAKLRDSTFSTVSEASMTMANTARIAQADSTLNDLLRSYADNLEYMRLVP